MAGKFDDIVMIAVEMVSAHEQFMDSLYRACKALSKGSPPPHMCTEPLRELTECSTLAMSTLILLPYANSMHAYLEESYKSIEGLGNQTSEFLGLCRDEPVLSRLLHPWTNEVEALRAAISEYRESANSDPVSDARIMRSVRSLLFVIAALAVLLVAVIATLVMKEPS